MKLLRHLFAFIRAGKLEEVSTLFSVLYFEQTSLMIRKYLGVFCLCLRGVVTFRVSFTAARGVCSALLNKWNPCAKGRKTSAESH